MKTLFRFIKWTSILLVSLIFLVSTIVMVRKNRTFDAPYPNIHASTDSAIVERGKAIVYGPAHCAHCHTTIDQLAAIERGELVPLTGGHIFDIPPAKIYTPNITNDPETGIGNWPDTVIARSLRYGVGHDGHALIDFMPFQHLSDDDLTAVISYLKAAPGVHNEVPKTTYTVLGNLLRAFAIVPVGPSHEIPKTIVEEPTTEYGKYLVESVANCRGCHTNRDMKTGKFDGPFYGGGFHMPSETRPDVFVVTPNISTDPAHGRLAKWTEDEFLARFRKGRKLKESTMPWGPFSRMNETQIRAIYKYITSLPPVNNDPGPVIVAIH